MRNNPHEDKEKTIMENMNIKILVVDDESRMRKLVKDFLAREGYTVLEAGDGMEAMDMTRCTEVSFTAHPAFLRKQS